MAEEKLNPAVETEKEQEAKDNASNPEQESGKTVSIAEMQRRLKQAEDKHQLELANLQADVQKQIEDAVAKAKMTRKPNPKSRFKLDGSHSVSGFG